MLLFNAEGSSSGDTAAWAQAAEGCGSSHWWETVGNIQNAAGCEKKRRSAPVLL